MLCGIPCVGFGWCWVCWVHSFSWLLAFWLSRHYLSFPLVWVLRLLEILWWKSRLLPMLDCLSLRYLSSPSSLSAAYTKVQTSVRFSPCLFILLSLTLAELAAGVNRTNQLLLWSWDGISSSRRIRSQHTPSSLFAENFLLPLTQCSDKLDQSWPTTGQIDFSFQCPKSPQCLYKEISSTHVKFAMTSI